MDSLISKKATGNSKEFSKKMNLSRRSLMGYLQAMKFLGFPVEYDKQRETYYYKEDGRMTGNIFKPLNKEEQKQINKNFSVEDKEECASALLQNNDENINTYCKDLFVE
ncbi:MAG TPA: hypothetical protein VG895_00005 [Patescibacteria group bacterium]|jgi:hypothetical protein|nr:hypothetical protein [Patescibacteria group bacterium]